MKYLVTGASGFIGDYVIKELLDGNNEVVASCRDYKSIEHKSWATEVTFIPLDIESFSADISLFEYFERPERMIHLAWGDLDNFNCSAHVNRHVFNQFYFLKRYVESGGKHLLVTGTCLEYGIKYGPIKENCFPYPVCKYGIAKNILRQLLEDLNQQDDYLRFQWIRLFYTYGNGQNKKSIIPQLLNAVNRGDKTFNLSGGEQLRDYLPVELLAKYICVIASQTELCGKINCCSGKPISIRTFIENYLAKHDLKIKLNFGFFPYNEYEPLAFWGDNTKLNSLIK